MIRHQQLFITFFVTIVCIVLSGCVQPPVTPGAGVPRPDRITPGGPQIMGVAWENPIAPSAIYKEITLPGARNEWVSTTLQISDIPSNRPRSDFRLRLRELKSDDRAIPLDRFSAAQILPMPVDVNRAGFVRHTGLAAETTTLPRALLPAGIADGAIDLGAAREGPSILYWIDLHLPIETPPGNYSATIDLTNADGTELYSELPLTVNVHDFVIPDERHLLMISRIEWDRLRALYPIFETVEPYLMSRKDERYAPSIKALDQLVTMAQAHRVQVVIPRLTPIVKWPANRPPQVYWDDYDSIVAPWLNGDAFRDKQPLGYWPLPTARFLDNYPPPARMQYWADAAGHFDQLNWLNRSAVLLEREKQGRTTSTDSIVFSAEAARILETHPRLRVTLPLEEEQIITSGEPSPNAISAVNLPRLFAAAPGLVFDRPAQAPGKDSARPLQWLRTDIPGLLPYVGAGGDERDVRLWAWLAYLRKAEMIYWTGALPQVDSPKQPADPNELVWFYPGSWFGVDEPVPTIQLKWLRRAQQDFEYLRLATQRGQTVNALWMARLMTKPVEIQQNQAEDALYALVSGTADTQAWETAQSLLAKNILLRPPGAAPDRQKISALDIETLNWAKPQERPTIIGRGTTWVVEDPQNFGPTTAMGLRIGIDIYNASDYPPASNTLEFLSMPPGWIVRPQPVTIPSLGLYHVDRFSLDVQVDPTKIRDTAHYPAAVRFTNGYTKRTTDTQLVVPAAACDRLPPGLLIDGSLDDWHPDDQIQDGPLVKLFTRPALQAQQMPMASSPTALYSGWSDDHFYVGFRLNGVSANRSEETRNFVDYQFRRAWGEDLCEILIQPVYPDNSVGSLLHVVCKPNGVTWIERREDLRNANAWQSFENAAARYSASIETAVWRGEVAIPWRSIIEPGKPRPALLRFNVTQHRHDSGESSSWAGPIDFGRDDSFTGVLFIRDPNDPNMQPDNRR